jgi:hypothetical protein
MRIVGAIYRLAEGGLSRKISYIDNKNRIAIFIALQRQVPGQKKSERPADESAGRSLFLEANYNRSS